MKIEISHFKLILLFGLLSILLMGCQSNETTAVAVQGTAAPTVTTSPPAATAPAMATATYQPTPTLIPTPTPTLSIVEKEMITSELYKTNANCELPCWWGIVPGETEWISAYQFLNAIASNIYILAKESESDQDFVAEAYFTAPKDLQGIEELKQYFIIENDKVVVIKPDSGRGEFQIISEILSTYGRPSEIWLETYGYSFGEIDPFRIVLFYPEKGIMVRYFDDADFQNDQVIGCFGGNTGSLILWSPELELTFSEALSIALSSGTPNEHFYKRLQEATEMDVETFYQTYLDPNTETCLETPIELWMDR